MAETRKKIGALWTKDTRGGGTHMTGELELPDGTKLPVIVFRNGFKTTENRQPDEIIYLREDSQTRTQDTHRSTMNDAPTGDEVF